MSEFWLSREEVREIDRRALEEFGVPGIVLMENAARGCAELLMELNPKRKPVTILCGPGNNGGDGFALARHLDNRGCKVKLFAVEAPGPPSSNSGSPKKIVVGGFDFSGLPPDARTNYEIVRRSGLERFPLSQHSGDYAGPRNAWSDRLLKSDCWIVDALFGTGLSRPLGPPFDELASIVNASSNPVLAIDIPSGLDCDSGEPLGPIIRATLTATFVALKRGFVNPASREWTGAVRIVDIGAPRRLVDEYRQRPR
jgi:NAD(P)H-hydrate epimerase